MQKSSSNASNRRGPSGRPGRTQRGRPASTEQKSLSTSDRESKRRGPDDMEVMSGHMTGNRFAALPPKVPAPGTPEEPSRLQSLQSDFTFHYELRQTKFPRPGKSSNAQASSFMPREDKVLASSATVFPCTNIPWSSRVPITPLPTSKAITKTQESKTPTAFALPSPPETPPPRDPSLLHLQNGLREPPPTSARTSPDLKSESPPLSLLSPDIISPEAQRRLQPQPLHPSFATSSPMTTMHQHQPVAHRRPTPFPAIRKDSGNIRTHYPPTDPLALTSSNGKILLTAAEIAAANYPYGLERVKRERKIFGSAKKFGRPRSPISRKGSRKAEQEEGWGDEGDRSGSEDKDEGEWELLGEEFGG